MRTVNPSPLVSSMLSVSGLLPCSYFVMDQSMTSSGGGVRGWGLQRYHRSDVARGAA